LHKIAFKTDKNDGLLRCQILLLFATDYQELVPSTTLNT